MGDSTSTSDTKFKEDHLVLPVATPLPHHTHNIKSGYQHDVLNSGLHSGSTEDMSSLHLAAHNRFLMGAPGPGGGSLDPNHFATSATNPFSIHRFLYLIKFRFFFQKFNFLWKNTKNFEKKLILLSNVQKFNFKNLSLFLWKSEKLL